MNNGTRWIVVATLVALGAGFSGAYTFLGQFAKKDEVQLIREEQQRRTATVYAVPRRLDDFERSIDMLRLDIKALELAVTELRVSQLRRLSQGSHP